MKSSCHFNLSCITLLTLSIISMSGCGDGLPKRVPVSGHVLIDGKPLEIGTLYIETTGQRSSYATLGLGGKFSISTFSENDGLMTGKHTVAIISKVDLSSNSVRWLTPKKYSNIATSGLEIDVPGPRNDVEINLTWDGGKPFVEKY
jgi:hypothetical protein